MFNIITTQHVVSTARCDRTYGTIYDSTLFFLFFSDNVRNLLRHADVTPRRYDSLAVENSSSRLHQGKLKAATLNTACPNKLRSTCINYVL